MPLEKREAIKALNVLWQLRDKLNEEVTDEDTYLAIEKEDDTLVKAISILHCYITDIIPAISLKLQAETDVQFNISPEAFVQTIEINCKTTRDPGLSLVGNTSKNGKVYYCISHVEKGTVLDKTGIFKRGDIIIDINNRPLSRVSLDKAHWLLKSAARSQKIKINMITCDGRTVPYPYGKGATPKPGGRVPSELISIPVQTEVQAMIESHSVVSEDSRSKLLRKPSFTPSIGSKDSNHETLMNTFEVAQQFSRSSLRYSRRRLRGKNHKLRKVDLDKDSNRSLGVRLTGGKGSKYGDVGIFVANLEKNGSAEKDGRLQKGDEILMINGNSVVGMKLSEVVDILHKAGSPVHFVIATKPVMDDLTARSTVSLESAVSETEILRLIAKRDTLKAPPPAMFSQTAVPRTVKRFTSENMPPLAKKYQKNISDGGVARSNVLELQELNTIQPLTQWGRLSGGKPKQTHPQVEDEAVKKTIVLIRKDNRPLGFSLCGGKGSKRGDIGLYVRSIKETGLAAEDGRLRVGDQLLAVNGLDMSEYSHKKAAAYIKSIKNEVVSLYILTGPGYLSLPTAVQRSLSVKGTPINVTCQLRDEEKLGLEVSGLTDDHDEYGIFINHIIPNSPADKCKLLQRADQLLSVNEHSLLDVNIDEAQTILSNVPAGEINIQLVRPQNVEPLNKLLSGVNRNGSFSMRQKLERSDENIRLQFPSAYSPLDKDILNLFTIGEKESTNEIRDSEDLVIEQETELQFPSVISAINDHQNDEDSLMKSLTPILIRPSIAAQYSPSSSPRGSITDLELRQVTLTRKESGLIASHQLREDTDTKMAETSFNDTKLAPPTVEEIPIQTDLPPLPSSLPPPPPIDEVPPSLPLGFEEIIITIHKQGKRGIGVTLGNSEGITNGYPLVKRVLQGGAGSKYGLKPGDRLVSINSETIYKTSISDIMTMLSESSKEFTLALWRDPNYDGDTCSSVHSGSALSDGGTEYSVRHKNSDSTSSLSSFVKGGAELDQLLSEMPQRIIYDSSGPPSRDSPLVIKQLSTSAASSSLIKQVSKDRPPPPPPRVSSLPRNTAPNQMLSQFPPTEVTNEPLSLMPNRPPPSPPSEPLSLPPSEPLSLPPSEPLSLPPSEPLSLPPSEPLSLPPTELPPNETLSLPHSELLSPPPSRPPLCPPSEPLSLPPSEPLSPPPTELPPNETLSLPHSELLSQPPSRPPPSPPIELLSLPPSEPLSPPPTETLSLPPTEPLSQPPNRQPSEPLSLSPSERRIHTTKKQPPPVPLPYVSHTKPKTEFPLTRPTAGPFKVEITKGLFSLGLTLTVDSYTGVIVVKNISSRSPLAKDGNLKVGDHVLTINDTDMVGLSLQQAEAIVKSLSRGTVKIIAMVPPRDVTSSNKPIETTVNDLPAEFEKEVIPEKVATPSATEEKLTGNEISKGHDIEEGVISVQITRDPGIPLGINIEGGTDTQQKYIYISSIVPNSPADLSGELKRGDQLQMCGNECLIGATSIEAWDILDRAPPTVEIVVARKSESLSQLRSINTETPTHTVSRSSSQESVNKTLKRRYSFSLHYTDVLETPPTSELSAPAAFYVSTESILEKATPSPVLHSKPELQEEEFVVVINRSNGQRLGFTVQGGADNLNLPHPHVKHVEPGGLAYIDGQIRRGDRLISVNDNTLDGLDRKMVLSLLKNAGESVTLKMSRQVGHSSSVAPSLICSKIQSKQGSGENTPGHSSGSPSPLLSRHGLRGRRTQSIASRLGLAQSQGIKVVELHKGPTGLGMHLKGSLTKDKLVPVTVKEVLPGGVAYKSNKISVGDVLLEANGREFEGMTQSEAVKTIKGLSQGTVRLVLLDKHYSEQQSLNIN